MTHRILIADDDGELVEVMADFLSSKGYDLVTAYEGIEVVEKARDHSPDLILLDWNMPQGKGLAVITMLSEKESLSKIPVVVVSGADEPGMREAALKMGVIEVIRKPYEPKQLLSVISSILKS